MNAPQKRNGQYLGTEIDHNWWQRYSKDGFFTRGAGEYWIEGGFLFFQHQVRQEPIKLPLRDIVEVVLYPCSRRAKLGVIQVIKLIWRKEGKWLCSGFVLSGSPDEISCLLASLRAGTSN